MRRDLTVVFLYLASICLGVIIGIFIVSMFMGADIRDEKKDTSFGVQGDLVAKAIDDVGPGNMFGDSLKCQNNLSVVRKAAYQVDSPWDLSQKEYGVIKLYLRHVLDEIDPTPTPTR